MIWRLEYTRARFVWLDDIWDENQISMDEIHFRNKIDEIIRGTIKFENAITIQKLVCSACLFNLNFYALINKTQGKVIKQMVIID